MDFEYYRILKRFNSKSTNYIAFPSLFSKYYRTKNEYFSLNLKSKKQDLYILLTFPIIIIRLIFTYILLLVNFIFCSLNSKKIILILTRELGIKNFNSLEDYRFKGLEELIKKKDFNVFYYYHGNKFFLNKLNVLQSRDIFFLSKNILNIYYLFRKIFPNHRHNISIWEYDLNITILSSYLISFYTKLVHSTFFWDFNYDHYSLFLGGYIGGSNLVGSMHNYHYIKRMPWISDNKTFELGINYKFNDYKSCYELYKKNPKKLCLPSIIKYKIKGPKIDLVLIEESQTDQTKTITFIKENKDIIDNFYIKLKPSFKNHSKLISRLENMKIEYTLIETIERLDKNIIVIGSSSTLLLDLASKGYLVLSFSNSKNEKPFNSPSREFVNLDHIISCPKDLETTENPITINASTDLRGFIENKTFYLKCSKAVNNNLLFECYKIDAIVYLILKL